ncbi:MAG: MCE family protein [Deltaproteobacteria bacterium]|nr:MCE family protein [Deltaproteobacteria bacterium]
MIPKRPSFLKLSPEAKVGLFVLLGIVILVYMSLRLGGIKFGRAEGYTLHVYFDSAAGLDKNASVRVAGVEVGRIKDIRLKDSKAHVILEIKPDVAIGRDFTAVLTTKGLLGEKYLELVPGAPNAPSLKEGEEITHTKSYADMDRLITVLSDVSDDVKEVTESLSKVLGGDEGEATLRNIVKNVEEMSFRVNHLIAKNDEQVGNVLRNLDEFTGMLKTEGPGVTSELKLAIKNLNDALVKTSDNLNQMITENRGNLKEGVENLKLASLSLQQAMDTVNKVTREIGPQISDTTTSVGSIARKIDKGEGTLGKLINDKTLHEDIDKTVKGINNYIAKAESFRTFIGYRGEFLFDERDVKSYFTLRIQPKADKFYLFEVVDDPRGKKKKETKVSTVDGVTTTREETTTSDAIKFSAQIAKRYKGVTFRGGIIESAGGAGIDYHIYGDRLKLSLEAFDFDKDANPHLKASSTFFLNKFFFLTAGYDDFASKVGLKSAYAGVGFHFEDEDIKYLLTSAPSMSF